MGFPNWIQCPECHNKRFTPTPDVPRPVKNIGDKSYFGSFATRRYVCLQCGHVWLTKEAFYRDVEVRSEPTLFTQPNDKR